MQKTMTKLAELNLVGIVTRTNNIQIFEGDPSTNKIAATAQNYAKFTNHPGPMPTVCIDMWKNI